MRGAGTNDLETQDASEPSWKRGTSLYNRRNSKKLLAFVAALCAAGALMFFLIAQPPKVEKRKERAVAVNIAIARASSLPLEIRTIGNVTPYSIVNVTPQVSGQLQSVFFKQGDFVKKGQLLFQIDPRPYEATLAQIRGNIARDNAQVSAAVSNLARDEANIGQARANLHRDVAQQKFAQLQKWRYGMLAKEGAISQESSDQMSTTEAQADAAIEADKRAIENAKAVTDADKALIQTAKANLSADQGLLSNAQLQLQWTKIYAPISGRTSSLNVNAGNIVAANTANPIVSIAQVNPIYVTASVPEQYLNEIRAMNHGSLRMQAMIGGKITDSVQGTISFMENTVNVSTGTIALRATFDNGNDHLYPGQFVDVVVTLPATGNTIVIPSRAIQTTQKGQSVYVVLKNGTVELRPVQVSRIFAENAAVSSGLAPGEIVVTDGQLQLVPGAKVQVAGTRAERHAGGRGRHVDGGLNAGEPEQSTGERGGGQVNSRPDAQDSKPGRGWPQSAGNGAHRGRHEHQSLPSAEDAARDEGQKQSSDRQNNQLRGQIPEPAKEANRLRGNLVEPRTESDLQQSGRAGKNSNHNHGSGNDLRNSPGNSSTTGQRGFGQD